MKNPKPKVVVIERDGRYPAAWINDAWIDRRALRTLGLPIPRPGKSVKVRVTVEEVK